MKKIQVKKFILILILTFLFCSLNSSAQTILKIQNNTFINLSNTSKLIISNPSVNPLQKAGLSGGIWTPSEDEKVIIDVSNLIGKFSVPFVSSLGNTISFDYNISEAGNSTGRILFSTYETVDENLPFPDGVTNLDRGNLDNSKFVIDRFWLIDVEGYLTKPKGKYTFTYDDNDLIGNSIQEPLLFMQRWNDVDSTWGDKLYPINIDINTNKIQVDISNQEDQFKVWTAVELTEPLPIELLSFNVNCETNKIEWVTLSERNNKMFILQGTNDGINFTNLDTIFGSGNSNQPIYYNVTIENWALSYFRLQQIDFYGLSVNIPLIDACPQSDNSEIILFPNPNNGQFSIRHNSIYTFEIFDMSGKLIWSENSNRMNFDFSYLNDGGYFIRLSDRYNIVKTFRFIKIN